MPNLPADPVFHHTNGLSMAVRETGKGDPVILLHGFPELSYSWRSQARALALAGWRAIVPDLRGYGDTGSYGPLSAYSMRNLSADIIGLMDVLGIRRSALIGHDFGGALAWSIARDHPERVSGIISLNTPYTRRGSTDLAETMRMYRGDNNYMVQFQIPGVAEALLEADVRKTFDGLMRKTALTLAQFRQAPDALQALPMSRFVGEPLVMGAPIMPEEELDVYVRAFQRSGFTAPLNWYRNFRQNWLDTEDVKDLVTVPALMVSAADDYFLPPETTRNMQHIVNDLEFCTVANCGHWIQYERPLEVNRIIVQWLERRVSLAHSNPR